MKLTRPLVRHTVALLATLGVLAACPFLAEALGSRVSRLLHSGDGFHMYSVSWSFGADGDGDDAHGGIDPLSSGVAILLAAITAVCVVGDVLRRKWPPLSWALPFLVSIPIGGWTAFLTRGGEIPNEVPIAIGIIVTLLALALVGTYWWTLRLTSLWKEQEAE